MKRDITQYNALNFERKILWFYGFYSGKDYLARKHRNIPLIISSCFSFTFITGMVLKVLEYQDDLETIFETAHACITSITGAIKLFCLYRALPHFNILEESLIDPIFNLEIFEGSNFISKAVKEYVSFSKFYWTMVFITFVLYGVFPVISGEIPIPIWYPADCPKFYVQIFEVISILILSCSYPGIELVLFGLFYLMSAQLDTLNYNLTNSTQWNGEDNREVQEEKIQDRLKCCIEHHLAIIRFINGLKDIFSFGIFAQIVLNVLIICTSALQFLRNSVTIVTLLSSIMYTLTILTQIGMLCWVGQNITTKSSLIGESCYMSDWYTYSVSTRKMFFIIMEKSKLVISFKVGNLFEISFKTFIMIIRSAYSFFAIVITMYK
uniref:Odorant receptor n=1 Tax=Anomala corpulenta TaxID=931571 RepID=A0A0E3U359_9SCAR|nr:odorant receptor 6 [Anomala corpulenta]